MREILEGHWPFISPLLLPPPFWAYDSPDTSQLKNILSRFKDAAGFIATFGSV